MQYIEKNIFTTLLKEDEIKYLLQRTENGTEDIISTRSKAFQELHRDLDDISIKELVDIIQKNPSILKRPIMINEKSFVVMDTTMMKLRHLFRLSCDSLHSRHAIQAVQIIQYAARYVRKHRNIIYRKTVTADDYHQREDSFFVSVLV